MQTYACLISVALCLTLLVACDKHNDVSRAKSNSESPLPDVPVREKSKKNNNEPLDTHPVEPHQYLRLTLHNNTEGDIDETSIAFGKHSCTFGIGGKGVSKGYLGWPHPVGTNALVRWRDVKKVNRQARIDLSKVYDPNVEGELMFTIAGTNVSVIFTKIDKK